MPYCCAVKSCANKIHKGSGVSFHRFPVTKPTRLRLWLLALDIDVNTDRDELRKYFVCSEHFVPGDYTSNGLPENGVVRRYLTPTAVPTVGVSPRSSSTKSVQVGSVNNRNKHELVDSYSSADTRLVSEDSPPSLLQQCDIKVEQAPIEEETQVHIQVEDEQLQVKHKDDTLLSEELPPSVLQQCHVKLERVLVPEETEVHRQVEGGQLKQRDIKVEQAPIPEEREAQLQWCGVKVEEDAAPEETEEQSPAIEVCVEADRPVTEETSCHLCDTVLVSEELPPSLLQQCDVKVEPVPITEETEVQVQVEDVQLQRCGVKVEEDAATEETEINMQVTEEQSAAIEVCVEADEPETEEKSCHLCGKTFQKCSYLMRHVKQSHKGHKAFKCPECNREFHQQYQLVLHTRTHTGEKPFACDFCGKAFSQNSSRVTHMRRHTGEKPYFCARCGKSFTTSNHLKFCKTQTALKVTPDKEEDTEEKPFRCPECKKVFTNNHHLIQHLRVHTGERPFSCDYCGKAFTQVSSRNVHMRQHTGEKPYFCDKCGNMVASKHHLKLCTGTNPKKSKKKFLCTTCGKRFQTKSNLKIHMEVHESWQRHINEKLTG